MTVSMAKRQKSRQRQMKDVFNLGEMRSKQVSGIKVSRLNDLNQKEDGNPFAKFSRLQQEQEKKTAVLLTGGVTTQLVV